MGICAPRAQHGRVPNIFTFQVTVSYRIENEQRVREEIMHKGREERRQKDEARKAEIRRQDEILANSRNMRSKTVDLTGRRDSLTGGGGIQVYHYKDKGIHPISITIFKAQLKNHHPLKILI